MRWRRILKWLVHAAGALFVAGLITEWRGFTLFDPYFFIPFACLSATIVPAIVSARPGILIRPIFEACAVTAIILALSVGLLNLAAPHGIWAYPSRVLVAEATGLSLLSAAATALLARFLMRRISAPALRWIFRAATLCAILAWRYWPLT